MVRNVNDEIKTDNGWFNIKDKQPKNGKKVIVILERNASMGVDYDFHICESIYHRGYPKGYFLKEDGYKVRYWRKKETYPYPSGVVQREIEDCKKNKISIDSIVNHQKKFGIDISYIPEKEN